MSVFTITVEADRTSVHVQAPANAVPERELEAAIEALQDERERLERCPAHRRTKKTQPHD